MAHGSDTALEPGSTALTFDDREDTFDIEVCSHEDGFRIIEDFFPSYTSPHVAQSPEVRDV